MRAKRSWQKTNRLRGDDAGKRAQPVYVCSLPGCEVHHKAIRKQVKGPVDPITGEFKMSEKWMPPERCLGCGGLAFDYFASTTEANRWAALRQQERIGLISKLRRQVPFPLMTMAPNGMMVKVADYVADHVFERDGKEVVEDVKPRMGKHAGVDPLAQLKLRWMAAQRGEEVEIYME